MGTFEQVARKLTDAVTAHDLKGSTKPYAADALAYDPMYPQPLDRDAIEKDTAAFFRAFPDMRFEILSVAEKDDRNGAVEMRMSGTHTGPLESPTGEEIPPTNKRVELKGAFFARLNERGEIVEERRYYDVGTMLRQLGLMPEQEAATAATR